MVGFRGLEIECGRSKQVDLVEEAFHSIGVTLQAPKLFGLENMGVTTTCSRIWRAPK